MLKFIHFHYHLQSYGNKIYRLDLYVYNYFKGVTVARIWYLIYGDLIEKFSNFGEGRSGGGELKEILFKVISEYFV